MDDDDREFEDFVREVGPRLHRAFLGTRGVDGAADAVSEATAYAWEHWDELRQMENPAGYLYRVGHSRTRSRKVAALPFPATVGLPDIEPGLIPALLALPDTQRTAVWLVHACGWTYAEVATATDTSTSMIGNHLQRAMARLRDELGVASDA